MIKSRRHTYSGFVGKLLTRPRYRCEGMHCIDLAQEKSKFWAAVNMTMNTVLPEYIRNFSTSSGNISFSRRILLLGLTYGHQGTHPTDTPSDRSPLPTVPWASSGTTVPPHRYTPAVLMFSSELYLLSI